MLAPLALDEFLDVVAAELGLDRGGLDGSELLLSDLHMDELGAFLFGVLLDRMLPGFRLPDQFDLEDVRLRDVHHYYGIARRQPAE